MQDTPPQNDQELRPSENLSEYFHHLSRDRAMGGEVVIPADFNLWPEEWMKVQYKSYGTIKKIPLLSGEQCKIEGKFSEILEGRSSRRNFTGDPHFVTVAELSFLLENSVRMKNLSDLRSTRLYPSPGGLYPCEIYIFVSRSKEIERGFYHYNFLEKSLELVTSVKEQEQLTLDGQRFSLEASFAVIITMVNSRILPKYGERGYRYALIEAGHIGQNLCLAATALKLKNCPCGGVVESQLEKLLQIDGLNEVAVYSIYFG